MSSVSQKIATHIKTSFCFSLYVLCFFAPAMMIGCGNSNNEGGTDSGPDASKEDKSANDEESESDEKDSSLSDEQSDDEDRDDAEQSDDEDDSVAEVSPESDSDNDESESHSDEEEETQEDTAPDSDDNTDTEDESDEKESDATADSEETTGSQTDEPTDDDSDPVDATNTDNGSDDDTGADTESDSTETENTTSSAAIEELKDYLQEPWSDRTSIGDQPFAAVPLTKDDAGTATELLWDDLRARIETERRSEVENKSISLMDVTLRYETVFLGNEPEGGRSLFISMHGGGNAPAETNNEQWQNQIVLAESYNPEDALWIAPRAPTDDWNMWFKDHIDPLFDRLISNMIVFENINPNKVYLTGYSAGGDAVYQLGPRMADRWAAAAMSAGHPNDASPVNLRNIGFAIHVGGDDTSYDRNLVAAEWGDMLDNLQQNDPEGYPHQVEVHPGLPHWMDLADQVSIPFVQSFERNFAHDKVVWRLTSITSSRFYWLHLDPNNTTAGSEITASYSGQSFDVETTGVSAVTLRVSDAMVDMDAPVSVTVNEQALFEEKVARTIEVIEKTLSEREDPTSVYHGELRVEL